MLLGTVRVKPGHVLTDQRSCAYAARSIVVDEPANHNVLITKLGPGLFTYGGYRSTYLAATVHALRHYASARSGAP